jgi:hypothetical protein
MLVEVEKLNGAIAPSQIRHYELMKDYKSADALRAKESEYELQIEHYNEMLADKDHIAFTSSDVLSALGIHDTKSRLEYYGDEYRNARPE